MDMDKNKIQQLLQRHREGKPLSAAERRWLDSFYVHYAKRSTHQIDDLELDKNLSGIEATIKRSLSPYRIPKRRFRFAVAATFLGGLLILGYYLNTSFGQQLEIPLPDGEMRE
ncbi:hypothetical protein M8994_20860, partial [Brucella sp. 21LCYQ03]|nr:hypothetical protein [Brucella sp. 21LCYQ03]